MHFMPCTAYQDSTHIYSPPLRADEWGKVEMDRANVLVILAELAWESWNLLLVQASSKVLPLHLPEQGGSREGIMPIRGSVQYSAFQGLLLGLSSLCSPLPLDGAS